jgi:hypothetical protein
LLLRDVTWTGGFAGAAATFLAKGGRGAARCGSTSRQ